MSFHVAHHEQIEVIEAVLAGVIVRIIKLHIVDVPVSIDIDLQTRLVTVTNLPAIVDCLITSEVIGLAPPKPKPAPWFTDEELKRLTDYAVAIAPPKDDFVFSTYNDFPVRD